MTRTLPTFMVLGAMFASGLAVTTSAAQAAPALASGPTPTRFALSAWGVGTAVTGGEVPVSSGRTAFRIIGCTNRAGIDRENFVAEVSIPGLGDVSSLKTRVWTRKRDGVVSSHSRQSIDRLVIGAGSGQGTLTLSAIQSRARAYHDAKGFHATYSSSVGEIIYRPVSGPREVLAVPSPGDTLEVPGLAKIRLGKGSRRAGSERARATISALRIEVVPSSTHTKVAHVSARIDRGVTEGVFSGSANATRATTRDSVATSGPNPFLPIGCIGTGGEVKRNDLASIDLGGQFTVSGARTSAMGDQRERRAWGYTRSSITEAKLGGGELVISNIVAKANVDRRGRKVVRTAQGTTVGSITSNGESHQIPEPGEELVIPGVATIRARVVERSRIGIKVTAVRIALLDGSGAVFQLGQARLSIKSAGV